MNINQTVEGILVTLRAASKPHIDKFGNAAQDKPSYLNGSKYERGTYNPEKRAMEFGAGSFMAEMGSESQPWVGEYIQSLGAYRQ